MQDMVLNTASVLIHLFVHSNGPTIPDKNTVYPKNQPEVSSMFPHMDIQIVLPFSDVSTFSAHEVLVIRVSEHMLREVGLISAPEITQATFVGLLSF